MRYIFFGGSLAGFFAVMITLAFRMFKPVIAEQNADLLLYLCCFGSFVGIFSVILYFQDLLSDIAEAIRSEK